MAALIYSLCALTCLVSAALHWRLFALVYDLFPLAALCFTVAALALLLRGGTPVQPDTGAAYAVFAAMLLTGFGYFALSWRRGGQTIGMRAWRLRLVDADADVATATAPGWGRLAVRALVALVSLAACGLGYLWSVVDRERRTWHDIASRTRVLRLPR